VPTAPKLFHLRAHGFLGSNLAHPYVLDTVIASESIGFIAGEQWRRPSRPTDRSALAPRRGSQLCRVAHFAQVEQLVRSYPLSCASAWSSASTSYGKWRDDP
jgi:hypothetical protein